MTRLFSRALLEKMQTEPEVKCCFFDFKKALWHAVESVFPGVERRECVFIGPMQY